MADKIRIYSIFNSIDGEVNRFYQGGFTTFIRFAGCNLFPNSLCSYCDTGYAQDPNCGKEMTITQIMKEVKKFGCKKVTITGGEPLMQMDGLEQLLGELADDYYDISVETNGTVDGSDIWTVECWIVDYKFPSSGIKEDQIAKNFINGLRDNDFVKFVITCKEDYKIAKKVRQEILKRLKYYDEGPHFAFSPMHGSLEPKTLIEWIQRDKLFERTIINLQLHKYIWLSTEKEV